MKPETLQNVINELKADLEKVEKQAKILRMAIETHQNLCPHKWADGTDAWVEETGIRYRIQKCAICGKEEDLR